MNNANTNCAGKLPPNLTQSMYQYPWKHRFSKRDVTTLNGAPCSLPGHQLFTNSRGLRRYLTSQACSSTLSAIPVIWNGNKIVLELCMLHWAEPRQWENSCQDISSLDNRPYIGAGKEWLRLEYWKAQWKRDPDQVHQRSRVSLW